MDVDDWQPQREACDFAFGGARDDAGAEGDVGAGAAHVEGDDARAVLFVGELGQSKGADHAAGGAAEDEAGGFAGGLSGPDGAAVGLHDADGKVDQLGCEALEVASHERKEVGVDDGGGGALILPVLGEDVAAEGDGELGEGTAQDIGGQLFMAGIAETVEEADGEALRCGRGQLLGGACEGGLVEGGQYIAIFIQPFDGFEAQVGGCQGIGADLVEIVEMGPVLAADLDDVDETGGGEQGGAGAAALEQGVGGDSCAVHELGVSGRFG